MSIEFKTPTQIADEYLTYLKGEKPDLDINNQDTDWWIKSRVVGGVGAGIYGDIRKVSNDAFPQYARRDAVERHLETYFGSGFKQPTQSEGYVAVTGTTGTSLLVGSEFNYDPNNNVYQSTATVILTTEITPGTATGEVPIISVSTGQDKNLLAGADLTLQSPPAGINAVAVALTDISDGTDVESTSAGAQRILDRLQNPPAGGTVADYKAWALEADPAVIGANVIRYPYGPGTVGVVVLSGTTDIDTALNNGDPIVRTPSDVLVQKVLDYIDALNPLTDCLTVFAPILVPIDVTVHARFFDGNKDTVPSKQLTNADGSLQTLTQGQLVIREVERAIYKTPAGGRQFGASGFVVASEIEENIDYNLSSEPYATGVISPILVDRQVEDLSASGANRMLLPTELAQPGTITLIEDI